MNHDNGHGPLQPSRVVYDLITALVFCWGLVGVWLSACTACQSLCALVRKLKSLKRKSK